MEFVNFQETFKLIKEKTTLQDVIQSYGISVPSPNKFIRCPFHIGDNTASLKLYNADSGNGSWFCFGCRKSGDLLSFVAFEESKTNGEALLLLTARLGISAVTGEIQNELVENLNHILNPKNKKNDLVDIVKTSIEARKKFGSLAVQNLTQYMVFKSINHTEKTRSDGNLLVIPLCDENENIWNLQFISPGGKKWYQGPGIRDRMLRLGNPPKKLIMLAEGYATAYSIMESLKGVSTYCCFTVGNVKNVFEILKEKYPNSNIIMGADNDPVGRSLNLPMLVPDGVKDWNDHYLKFGLEKTQKKLLEGLGVESIEEIK
jgi:putative DNA primase/helicase